MTPWPRGTDWTSKVKESEPDLRRFTKPGGVSVSALARELSRSPNSAGEPTPGCISHKLQCGQQQRVEPELPHLRRRPPGTLTE